MKINKNLTWMAFLGIFFIASNLMADSAGDSKQAVAPPSSEELIFMDIPVVVTASKETESINKAPAIIYVITQDEIKISGARSLAEILKRVPGMHISIRESSLLGSRGFTSDQNDKFLFLIDGTPIENIMQDGSYNFIDMPNLNMVEKIEIVKGPGSTLWGSDATFGIINIFTKKGSAVGGTKVSADYSTGNNQFVGNVLNGNKLDNGDYLVSFTYSQSKGAAYGSDTGNNIYEWGNPDKTDIIQGGTTAPALQGDDAARMLAISPSFELYSKVTLGDYTFKARASYMAQAYLWNTVYGYKYSDADMKHLYMEAERVDRYSATTFLTTKLDAHGMLYERGIPEGYGPLSDSTTAVDIETMTEIGFSGESTFNTVIADVHRLIAGIKFERINVGPDLRTQYSPDMSDTNNLGYLYVITLKPAIDDTMSAYVEDNYDITDKLTLVAGLSYAYNDLREVGGDFMPRASVIYQLTDEWSGKYAYNTGYGRPPVMKKLGIYYGHATESEKTNEHDLQLAYNNRQFRMTVTGFNYNINDYFTWYDDGIKDPVTGVDMNSGDFNKGNATSTGVEFDSRGYIGKIFSIYASFEYANTIVNHALSVGEPKDVYNAGLDWYIVKDLSANLNVNGFIDMFHGYDASGNAMFWSGATEQIVDLSVIAENILNRYDLTVYCNNVLNNKVHVGMTGWPGYTYLGGVSVGVKLAASF